MIEIIMVLGGITAGGFLIAGIVLLMRYPAYKKQKARIEAFEVYKKEAEEQREILQTSVKGMMKRCKLSSYSTRLVLQRVRSREDSR